MMSTGTLRALALISALRHPEPPTLLVVEEIENSLDPRTLGLVVDVIRRAVRAGRTQVIVTTHSPQLLDMVLLKHLVFVQRYSAGEPVFYRPADQAEVRKWAESFSPGGTFTRGFFRQLA
jgi:predicted ATPase